MLIFDCVSDTMERYSVTRDAWEMVRGRLRSVRGAVSVASVVTQN